jgi:hypothetical protein
MPADGGNASIPGATRDRLRSRLVRRTRRRALETSGLAHAGNDRLPRHRRSREVYVRGKNRTADAARALRREPWCEAIYSEDASAQCDKTLRELHAYFPGRSPDLMADIDDNPTATQPYAGNHGSLRESDMRIPLMSGAGVAKCLVFGKASLIDVAPTIVRLFGLPGSVLRPDGRALEEALDTNR